MSPGRTAGSTFRASLTVLALACAACTPNPIAAPQSRPSSTPTAAVSPAPDAAAPPIGPGSTEDPNCPAVPHPTPSPPTPPGSVPPEVSAIERQVASIRGLSYLRPVTAQAVTAQEMSRTVTALDDAALPAAAIERSQRAWITMGLIPAGTDLRQALIDFAGTQALGFYDQDAKRLVFIGADLSDPLARYTLAHELTHALDDQHFDLRRLDALQATCQDEPSNAYTALAEGDAVDTSNTWAQRNLSASELAKLLIELASGPPVPANVPPFVRSLEYFPYDDGPGFVDELRSRGGDHAVNQAFEDPPVSTEQILEPEAYPTDTTFPLAVRDLSTELGAGWHVLDGMGVGQGFLRAMLALRPASKGSADVTGWGGGRYLAWTDGSAVAVLLRTTWDAAADAERFAAAAGLWVGADPSATVARPYATEVDLLFGSNARTLSALETAVGASSAAVAP